MNKYVVVVAALGLGAAAALGAVTKVRAFRATGAGTTLNPDVDGMAIAHFKADVGNTQLIVNVTDLQPGVTYGVVFESANVSMDAPNAFTTNAAGNGHCQFIIEGIDASTVLGITIYVDADSSGDYTAGEERAAGVL